MAFTLVWADVEALDAAFRNVKVETQEAILADVDAQLSEANLGSKYTLACKYLAAHVGALVLRSGDALGNIASESVGSVSRSYSTAPLTDPVYQTTKWGILYKTVVRQSAARIGVLL